MTSNRLRSTISQAELERRWAAARAMMVAEGIDALVMQNASDWVGGYVRWFSDLAATNGYPRTVIFYADRPMTVIEMGAFDVVRTDLTDSPAYRGVARLVHTPSFASIAYSNRYDADLLVAELQRTGARNIGLLAPDALPCGLVDALRAVSGLELSDASNSLDAIKAIKSPEEIVALGAVAALQDAVFAKVCASIRPGLSDLDIANIAQAEAHRLGSDQGILLGSSAPLGVSARFMGRALQGRTLQAGDHFSLLIEVNGPSGLYTEIARTIVLGKASSQLLERFELMRAAQDHTLSRLLPGVLAAEIAQTHDDWMTQHGLPPETRLYAHGQGVDMVERPLIRHDETMAIQAGMCLAVHPGFDDGVTFSVICDNYMVESDGPSPCMHQTAKRIFEV